MCCQTPSEVCVCVASSVANSGGMLEPECALTTAGLESSRLSSAAVYCFFSPSLPCPAHPASAEVAPSCKYRDEVDRELDCVGVNHQMVIQGPVEG